LAARLFVLSVVNLDNSQDDVANHEPEAGVDKESNLVVPELNGKYTAIKQ